MDYGPSFEAAYLFLVPLFNRTFLPLQYVGDLLIAFSLIINYGMFPFYLFMFPVSRMVNFCRIIALPNISFAEVFWRVVCSALIDKAVAHIIFF